LSRRRKEGRKEAAALRWRGEERRGELVGAREGRLRPQWLGGGKERER